MVQVNIWRICKVARSGPCIVGGGGSHTYQRSVLPGAMVKLNEHLK